MPSTSLAGSPALGVENVARLSTLPSAPTIPTFTRVPPMSTAPATLIRWSRRRSASLPCRRRRALERGARELRLLPEVDRPGDSLRTEGQLDLLPQSRGRVARVQHLLHDAARLTIADRCFLAAD